MNTSDSVFVWFYTSQEDLDAPEIETLAKQMVVNKRYKMAIFNMGHNSLTAMVLTAYCALSSILKAILNLAYRRFIMRMVRVKAQMHDVERKVGANQILNAKIDLT